MFNTDIFSIPISDNRKIVYIPLRSTAFLADDESCSIIDQLRGGEEVTNSIQNTRMYHRLCELEIVSGKDDDRPALVAIQSYKPTKLTILLTESCNLNCTYCYANAFPQKNTVSSLAIRAAIDLIIVNALEKKQPSVSITFLGGGEPTLYWNNIVETVEYADHKCSESKIELHTVLVTNGTLLDEAKILWINTNINHVTLSFDILPEIQGKQRPYLNGRNSHPRVSRTLQYFSKSNCAVSIRSTITRYSVEYMVDMVEYIYQTTAIKKLHLEPLSEMGRSVKTSTLAPDDSIFIREFMRARSRGKQLGIDVECSISKSLERVVSRACDIEFCVTSDNVVTACHRISRTESENSEVFQYGSYADGSYLFDVAKINSLRLQNVTSFGECQNCFAKWNCGGDCIALRMAGQDRVRMEGKRCNLIRDLLKELLFERIGEGENG